MRRPASGCAVCRFAWHSFEAARKAEETQTSVGETLGLSFLGFPRDAQFHHVDELSVDSALCVGSARALLPLLRY